MSKILFGMSTIYIHLLQFKFNVTSKNVVFECRKIRDLYQRVIV